VLRGLTIAEAARRFGLSRSWLYVYVRDCRKYDLKWLDRETKSTLFRDMRIELLEYMLDSEPHIETEDLGKSVPFQIMVLAHLSNLGGRDLWGRLFHEININSLSTVNGGVDRTA
jgi:hypothetical protein